MAAATGDMETAAVDLGALLDAREGAVVTLVAGETRLAVHKAVLAARSPVFDVLFRQLEANSDEVPIPNEVSIPNEVPIPNMEGPVLRQLLAYCYTLQAPQLPPGLAPQLLAAAQKFRVLDLMNECEQQVAAQLSVETAAAAAVVAVKYGCPRLEEAAISFITSHNHQVMATRGWEDALRSQPDVAVKVTRLLAEPPAETSVPAAPEGRPTTGAQHQHQRQSQPHDPTPVAAVPPTSPHHTQPPGDDAVSVMRSLSAEGKGQRLIEAAKEGAVRDVEALLAAGADVGTRDEDMNTALHFAALNGHVEAVRRLLLAGAEVDARNTKQSTPLHCASEMGYAAVVRLLVASSADPDARQRKQWTPLHFAARRGHAAVVRFLVAASADIDARQEDNWTPLHMAAHWGHADAAAALLKAGGDRAARALKGQTPLDLARQRKHRQLIDILK